MSWVTDIKEMFARTELEKKISEASLQAEASVKIASKLNDFKEEYTKLSKDADVKNIADRLLKKIEII